MPAKAIMFQGTGSDVGKSLVVAGLVRHFKTQGFRVRPFKPQNMSNNAAVTVDGGEIGRAQALQARAAREAPSVHMNPVLLKPQSEIGAQVIVQGRVIGTAKADEYQSLKPQLMGAVLDSFAHISADCDIVLIEGAGSASEINLRMGDIANMGFARAAGVPVVLVGDIDRGGVIASLVGTQAVLDKDDAEMIQAFIVNKFRGDSALFDEGMTRVAELTGWRGLGLVPFFNGAHRLPAEDVLGLDKGYHAKPATKVRVAVLAYPRISNFDDFDPLRLEPGVDLVFVQPGSPIPSDAALVILPGSKATIADLAALRATGWDIDLQDHLRRGGHVLGICGGYQMLGRTISDPHGIEGSVRIAKGLGLLNIETQLSTEKLLVEVSGQSVGGGVPFKGYEMHVGRSTGPDCQRPVVKFADGRVDGAVSADGRAVGCHVHGLFSDDGHRSLWMNRVGAGNATVTYENDVESTLDALGQHMGRHIDCDSLLAIAREPQLKD